MDIKKVLGKNIRKYRKIAGLTQDELAEKLDISPKHLSNIEVGKKFITADLLEKISRILEASPAALFYTSAYKKLDDDQIALIEKNIDEHIKTFSKTLKEKIRDLT